MNLLLLLQIADQTKEKAQEIKGDAAHYLDILKDIAVQYAPKLVGAILLYIIGSWIINKVSSAIRKILTVRTYDPSLQTFLISLIKVVLNVVLVISIAGMLGVDTTAFGALLVGAGVAIGSALNGTLGNFAGGVMILVFKPFKLNDLIEAQGITGTVIEQGVFNTTLLTSENKTVYLPNGPLSTGVITNLTAHGSLRVDLPFAIASHIDISKARQSAIKAMSAHPKVLNSPAPELLVTKVGDGMVSTVLRCFCKQEDYWDVYFGCNEAIKLQFDQDKIEGPVPTKIIYNK